MSQWFKLGSFEFKFCKQEKIFTFSWTLFDDPSCLGMANPLQYISTTVINKELSKISICNTWRFGLDKQKWKILVKVQAANLSNWGKNEKIKQNLVTSPTQIPSAVVFFTCTSATGASFRRQLAPSICQEATLFNYFERN